MTFSKYPPCAQVDIVHFDNLIRALSDNLSHRVSAIARSMNAASVVVVVVRMMNIDAHSACFW